MKGAKRKGAWKEGGNGIKGRGRMRTDKGDKDWKVNIGQQ